MEAGKGLTEVRLDIWCEGGLRHQRDDGGGYMTISERKDGV